jgi:site-specific recombinase XerD
MKLDSLITKTAETRWLGPSASAQIRNARRCCMILGNPEAHEVTYSHLVQVQKALEGAAVSGPTINRHLAALMTALREGARLGVATVPPSPRRRKERCRERVLSEDEVSAITANMPSDLARFVWFLFDTGMRVSEAAALRASDVRDGVAYVKTLKGGANRSVPLTKRAMAAWQAGFPDVTQDRLNSSWNRAKKQTAMASDRDVVPHALRHSAASRLVSAGMDIFVVKEFLGHRDLKTTTRYTHLSPRRLRAAADILDTDR